MKSEVREIFKKNPNPARNASFTKRVLFYLFFFSMRSLASTKRANRGSEERNRHDRNVPPAPRPSEDTERRPRSHRRRETPHRTRPDERDPTAAKSSSSGASGC